MRINVTSAGVPLMGSAMIALSSCSQRPEGRQVEKPNVVFLLADDLRWNSMGCAGNSMLITPNIDYLARNGIRFSNACVTSAISMVSRANLLTGQYMSRHGIRQFGVKLSGEAFSQTYPALLRKSGYWTGYVGKYGVGKIAENSFDFSVEYEGRHWIKEKDGDSVHVTTKNRRDALKFLRERPAGKPFLLTVGFFATHAQDNHPDQYLYQAESEKYYRDEVIPVPETASEEYFRRLPPFIANEANEGRIRWRWRFDTPEKYQRYMKAYYRMLTELDQAVGEITAELKNQGVYDNTIIIFMGDNGYFHGEHGLADKWYPYEESIRVPLIVVDPRLPESKRNTVNEEFVLNIDIAPSVVSAAGLSVPDIMQGEDFSRLYLNKRPEKWRKDFYYEHPFVTNEERIPSSEALVTHTDKYIFWPFYKHEEYFDLEKDPMEKENSVSAAGYSKRISELKARFVSHKEKARGEIPCDTAAEKTISYKKAGNADLQMKLCYPSSYKGKRPLPAIVFFFGGGWTGGNINQFKPHAGYLASRGMIAVLADYRVKSRHNTTPFEAVADAKSAIRYLRTHAKELGIDPDRIAAGGGSAGGHLAAAAGNIKGLDEHGEDQSVSSRPDALVLFNPVFDNGPEGYGFDRAGVEDRYREISPIHNIRENAPPSIVFLGTNDKLIPVATAEKYKKLMEEAGSRCDLFLYEGETHGFFNKGRSGGEYFLKTLYETDLFLESLGYLKGKPSFTINSISGN